MTDKLDLNNEEMYRKEIITTFEDNGDWEYTRMGIGGDEKGLYVVDLEDTGEELRQKHRAKKGMTVNDIVKEGKEAGVLISNTPDTEDVSVNMEASPDDWATFISRIK